jgi:hypothetical protein
MTTPPREWGLGRWLTQWSTSNHIRDTSIPTSTCLGCERPRLTRGRSHPGELVLSSSTVRRSIIEPGSRIEERRPNLRFLLGCVQEGLGKVAYAKHMEGTSVGRGQQRDRVASSESTSPKTSRFGIGNSTQDHVDTKASTQASGAS